MGSTDPKGEGGGRVERMPSRADIDRIPQAVRDHALVMLQLGAAARAARKRWTDLRDEYKRWIAGDLDTHIKGAGISELATLARATRDLWDAEHAQEQGAGIYREQLSANNARPAGERWNPTILALWTRCSIAAGKPA